MKPIRPAPPVHHSPGELIDDDHLVFLDDVIDVPLEHHIRLQALVQMMDDLGVLHVIEVRSDQQPGIFQLTLGPFNPIFGQGDVLGLLVLLIVLFGQDLHDPVDLNIEIALVVGRARNNQRGAGLVDQDRIDFIDNRMVERPVDHLAALMLHIVAQIVEAQLVVGGIGNVGLVGLAAFILGQIGHDHAHGQPQEGVDLPHPFSIAPGEVIVDCDDVDALALKRVEIDRQGGDQRLAFAGAHFGDLTPMQHDPADHLNIEVAHAEHTDAGFTDRSEGFGQQIVERFAFFQHPLELGGLGLELLVAQRRKARLISGDQLNSLVERFDVTIVGRSENSLGNGAEHGNFLNYLKGMEHWLRGAQAPAQSRDKAAQSVPAIRGRGQDRSERWAQSGWRVAAAEPRYRQYGFRRAVLPESRRPLRPPKSSAPQRAGPMWRQSPSHHAPAPRQGKPARRSLQTGPIGRGRSGSSGGAYRERRPPRPVRPIRRG